MIDPRLTGFLDQPAMLIAAAGDGAGRAAIARVMGVRPGPAWGFLDLFVSRAQWPKALQALGPGAWMALTLCRPSTYETYQVKGEAEAPVPADPADRAFADAYVRETAAHLLSLGVGARQIASWLTADDLVRVRLHPERLFAQTPGPGAGRSLGEAAA